MAKLQYTREGFPWVDASAVEAGPSVASLVGSAEPFEQYPSPLLRLVDAGAHQPPANALAGRGVIDQLLGLTGPRYQMWPEKMVRSGLSLPGDVFTGRVRPETSAAIPGAVEPYSTDLQFQDNRFGFGGGSVPNPESGLARVQDLLGLVLGGGIGGTPRGAVGTSGSRAVAPKIQEPFYSAVEHAIRSAPQDRMPADQWVNWLRNQPGVKQEELDWLGISDLAAQRGRPMTREQMLEQAESSGVKIKEVEKREDGEMWHPDDIREAAALVAEDRIAAMRGTRLPLAERRRIFDEVYEEVSADPAAYGDYLPTDATGNATRHGGPDLQLPGGENYRELLLMLPDKKTTGISEWYKGYRKPQDPEQFYDNPTDVQNRLEKIYTEAQKHLPDNYISSHWDEPNVLVHLRMNDRTFDEPSPQQLAGIGERMAAALGTKPEHLASGAPQSAVAKGVITPQEAAEWSRAFGMRSGFEDKPGLGTRALHLEEIQSDWHQTGRKEGYKYKTPDTTGWKAKLNETATKSMRSIPGQENVSYWEVFDNTGRFKGALDAPTEKDAINLVSGPRMGGVTGVPDAPFKNTWADLALKRALAKAVSEGYDAISWTPGGKQAERYDLSKKVKEVGVAKNLSGNGYDIQAIPLNARNPEKIASNVPADKVADHIGKDLAEKLVKQSEAKQGEWAVASGLDLQVGGEGMKKFYDKMLVDKANALAKKFGGKVEYKMIPPEGAPHITGGAKVTVGDPLGPMGKDHPDIQSGKDQLVGIYHDGEWYLNELKSKSENFTKKSHKWTVLGKQFDTKQAAQQFVDNWIRDNSTRVPFLRITDKMREHLSTRGQPLFARGLPFQFTPVDYDPFKEPRR